MTAEVQNTVVTVKLSRRNILSLLHKLEMEGSSRTLVRSLENGLILSVTVEEDDISYQNRVPGGMHPETEAFVQRNLRIVKKVA